MSVHLSVVVGIVFSVFIMISMSAAESRNFDGVPCPSCGCVDELCYFEHLSALVCTWCEPFDINHLYLTEVRFIIDNANANKNVSVNGNGNANSNVSVNASGI